MEHVHKHLDEGDEIQRYGQVHTFCVSENGYWIVFHKTDCPLSDDIEPECAIGDLLSVYGKSCFDDTKPFSTPGTYDVVAYRLLKNGSIFDVGITFSSETDENEPVSNWY